MNNVAEHINNASTLDSQLLAAMFTISIAVISLLLFALIFFVKKQINLVETLQGSVNTLNLTITRVEEKQNNDKESHQVINARLGDHSRIIRDHETRISVIEKKQ